MSNSLTSSTVIATDLAAELLGTAMRETEGPVMDMASALARINQALRRAELQSGQDGDCGCRDLQQDISICIESLQFHDRLIQQLTAVRRLMGSAPAEHDLSSGFLPAEGTIEIF